MADTAAPHADRVPVARYLAPGPPDEIALARSAAAPAIAHDAEVLTLGTKGYERAVKGKNSRSQP